MITSNAIDWKIVIFSAFIEFARFFFPFSSKSVLQSVDGVLLLYTNFRFYAFFVIVKYQLAIQ